MLEVSAVCAVLGLKNKVGQACGAAIAVVGANVTSFKNEVEKDFQKSGGHGVIIHIGLQKDLIDSLFVKWYVDVYPWYKP